MPYITNFTPKAYGGDPQNWVSVQDARGLIYVANHKQILEYDGVTWNHLASEPDTDFFSLAIDSTGMLFAGAVGNLGYLAPDEVGRLHFVSLLDQIPERYRDFDHVWKIIALPEGVYFQSHKYLFRWDGRRFDVWEAETRFEQALTVGPSIYLRREGTGLMQVVGDSLRLVPQGERFADDRVYVMLRYAEDTLLVGARNQGLFLYDGRSFTPFPTPADAWLNEAQLYCGVVLGGGSRFALGTLQGGLLIIDREGNPVQVLDKESGLLDQQIHYIQTDREGALWLSFNIGLARVDLAAPYTLFDETNGLTGTVNVVLRHQGRVHASTSQGVFYLDGTTQHPGVPAPNPSFQRLAQPDVYTLALLPVDETLMATTAEGVHLLRNGGHRLLETAWIWPVALYRSRFHPERIYVGLSDGLAVLERDGEAWIDQGQVPEIRGDVRSFAEEDAQTLWVGTDKRGAWRIASGEIQHFEASANLPAGAVSVHYAGEHVLFATAKGLRRFDTATGQFLPDTRFGAIFADTLRSIQNIVEASDGVVYVQSVINDHPELHRAIPAGTDTYDHEKVPIPTLADGDLVYYIRPEADGTVWFGGTNGLVRYRSGRSPLKRQPIPAFIRQVSTTRHDSVIFAGVTPASSPPLVLPFLDNALRFGFAAPYFGEAAITRYQFMLDGFDETWSDWTTETRKDYTNLPEGTYRFRVRARDAFDEPGSEASFAFVLLPPWYRTTWAYLFYALVGVLALVGLDHLRRRRMAHKTRALEAVVETRTAEVRARNEDLRKQKRITEAQAERLRELDELKNRFFANISHEFRTPLTLTIGPLEDVLERQDLSDEVTADLDLALRNARRLLRLTNQILDIAKLEAGQMVLHRQYADLGAFAEDIALAFSPLAERQDVAYRIETRPVLASFDPDQFEKVIINLLSNAFKFTPKGNAILLRVEAVGGTAQLTVRNNGPGIPAEKLPHLFERFYQVDSSSTRVQTGTGIGLALVKELVELHDGTVAVESEEGFGTTFTVALPQAKAVGDEQISASGQSEAQTLVRDLLTQPASQESSPTMPQGNKAPDDAASEDEDRTTVLVVDDNAEVRTFIRRRLEDTYRVVEAADGAAGLEAARRVLPDLILCDVMMPGMDGYELCRTLKADPELDYLPVILLTAKASPESKIEGLHEGADDYLTKPFEARELIARVANLIDSRRRLQARFSTSLPTHQAVSLPAPPKGFAQQVREVVEAHLTDPDFSVERLADALNQSRSNLHRRLTLEMDESPTTFIRRVRLEHGAALLAERDGTISEVAYAVGFKSVSHFSQCFRKHFDMTPSEFVGLAPQEKGATSVGTPGA